MSDRAPGLDRRILVCDSSQITGDVDLGDLSSVWFGAAIVGVGAGITIGPGTNVQERTFISARQSSVIVGRHVTIGHGATLVDCTVGEGSLIAIGSVVEAGVNLPPFTYLATRAVVRPEVTMKGAGYLLAGNPARALRKLSKEELKRMEENAEHYQRLVIDRSYEGVNSFGKNT